MLCCNATVTVCRRGGIMSASGNVPNVHADVLVLNKIRNYKLTLLCFNIADFKERWAKKLQLSRNCLSL